MFYKLIWAFSITSLSIFSKLSSPQDLRIFIQVGPGAKNILFFHKLYQESLFNLMISLTEQQSMPFLKQSEYVIIFKSILLSLNWIYCTENIYHHLKDSSNNRVGLHTFFSSFCLEDQTKPCPIKNTLKL